MMSDCNVIESAYDEIVNSIKNLEKPLTPVKIPDSELKILVKRLIIHVWEMYLDEGKTVINIHSQGFIRLIITDHKKWVKGNGIRLHIWHDDILPPFETVFNKHHRHSFLSESFLILGNEITDNLYDTSPAEENTPNAVRIYKTPLNNIIPDKIITLNKTTSRTAKKGFMLHYPMNLFHLHKKNSGLVVTLFRKHSLNEYNPVAETIGPLKVPLNQNEAQDPRKVIPNQDEMWKFVLMSLIKMATVYKISEYPQIRKIELNINAILNNRIKI
jgi:hypothetical protein